MAHIVKAAAVLIDLRAWLGQATAVPTSHRRYIMEHVDAALSELRDVDVIEQADDR